MKSPLLRRIAPLFLLIPFGASAAVTVVLPEPGYLVIDSTYYVYDLPKLADQPIPAELHPLNEEGFFLLSDAVIGDCPTDEDESAGDSLEQFTGLRIGQQLDVTQARRFGLRKKEESQAVTISLAACDGAVVMFASTESGATPSCSASVGFPFRRGKCPAVDNADPGLVFFNAFEPR